ncbi:hypothetical protein ACRRTK_020939 [Alexandromys fortis]
MGLRYCRCLDTAVIVFPTCASNKFVSAEERTKSFLRVCTEAGIQESPVQGQTADSVDGLDSTLRPFSLTSDYVARVTLKEDLSKEDILTYHAADFHPDAINLLNVKYTDKSVCDSVIWRHLKGTFYDQLHKTEEPFMTLSSMR